MLFYETLRVHNLSGFIALFPFHFFGGDLDEFLMYKRR